MHRFRSRFAPSPTGAMHLGHAFAALVAADLAADHGGEFLVRIEDIDRGRCRPHFEEAIFDDLRWLGLRWCEPVRRQSEHLDDYAAALAQLSERRLTYPCFCTRRDIADEIRRSPSAPHGPEGALYPGMCRELGSSERADRIADDHPFAVRLDMRAALSAIDAPLEFHEDGRGSNDEHGVVRARPEALGDVVLARKDVATSYHLSVTVDDALQSIACVTRGRDLFFATHLHRLLQHLLGLPTPSYHHHDLVRDSAGKRLATRTQALALSALRSEGATAESIRLRLGLHRV